MKRFKTNSVVSLSAGLIKLTAAQAAARKEHLKETDDKGVYEITGLIQFKSGEEFGFDGDHLNRTQADCLEESSSTSSPNADKIAKLTKTWTENTAEKFRNQFPTVEDFLKKNGIE